MNHSLRSYLFPAVAAALLLSGELSAQTATAPSPAAPAATPAAAPDAAPGHRAWHHHRGPLQRLRLRRQVAEKLGITAEQKAQLKTARQSAAQQIRALRADTTLTPEERKARIHAVVTGAQQQMQQVLTPEQRQQLEQLRAERRARREANRSEKP